jgi:hypothetical protein
VLLLSHRSIFCASIGIYEFFLRIFSILCSTISILVLSLRTKGPKEVLVDFMVFIPGAWGKDEDKAGIE